MSDAWKNHERKVAEFFGVKRRARGADFGQSDIEIVVPPGKYVYTVAKANSVPIFVECKYRKNLGIVDSFRDHYKKTPSSAIPLLRIGTHFFCDLNDFGKLYEWIEAIYCKDINTIINIPLNFNIKTLDIKLPKYISEYIEQAKQYRNKVSEYKEVIPLACVTSYKSNHRVVCLDLKDIPFDKLSGNKIIL